MNIKISKLSVICKLIIFIYILIKMDEKECLKKIKAGQKDLKTGLFSFKFLTTSSNSVSFMQFFQSYILNIS